MRFLADAPRFLFFTGKGGVGKTSIACASAVRLAEAGASVLLVSTDPASNVGQVFGVSIGNTVTPIAAVPGLWALEIDPEQAAEQYRERIVGPVRGLLPPAEVATIEEQLSGACTTEIASFNEFTDLLTDAAWTAAYDHILFDTAPTGHTIRLLQLPGSWTDFLTEGTGDASCLGPLSGLEKQRAVYADAVAALADPARTRLVLVARAQNGALREAARTQAELSAIGMERQYLVVNGILPAGPGTATPADAAADPLFAAIRAREQKALAAMPEGLRSAPTDHVELKSANMVGLFALRSLLEPEVVPTPVAVVVDAVVPGAPLSALIDEIEAGGHGLVMLMGKGGVGKTTLAAAIAVSLAERGLPVHLTTTDPAAHLDDTLAGGLPHLTVSRIDPAVEIAAYTERVMSTKGAQLDEQGQAMLREDLRSPCTEEIAVFQAFSRVSREARNTFVVMDTAPTGHTLLLLDATGSYHREVTRQLGGGIRLTTPMMRLQDPKQTKVILVTLAETTPVLEAAELQADLERAGITPWAWIVNNSIAAAAPTSPLLLARARNELIELEHVHEKRAPRLAVVPLLAEEPVGIPALLALAAGRQPAPASVR
ncbi:arsenical pump-driving ATPase [Cryobacterium breve]|uniref:Arsenical pump-driving ATPase n=1 Tax=Cryobacterium breve TaxID=1259258 RepID=A0ABY2IWD6_9MICO|nr:arsenical pump-driving ATPase [Cryobacterium sp. TmT3-12]TFC96200.1 arsenical pump-driving ATPase [Cryobacterium breve]